MRTKQVSAVRYTITADGLDIIEGTVTLTTNSLGQEKVSYFVDKNGKRLTASNYWYKVYHNTIIVQNRQDAFVLAEFQQYFHNRAKKHLDAHIKAMEMLDIVDAEILKTKG